MISFASFVYFFPNISIIYTFATQLSDMHKSRLKTWAHLSLLAANIIYGLNYSIAKAVMPDHIKPFALVSLRSISAAALFWITSLFMPKEPVSRKDLLFLFGCSFFGVVINQTLFLVGLDMTTPINSSIILSTNPIFAFVFAALILRERITFLKGTGLAIGLSGVLLLILQNGTPDLASTTFLGDIYTLVNTISWAFYTVIIKRMLEKYHPVTVMKWTFLFGMLTNIPAGYHQWSTMDWSSIPLTAWLQIRLCNYFCHLPRLSSYNIWFTATKSDNCQYLHIYSASNCSVSCNTYGTGSY